MKRLIFLSTALLPLVAFARTYDDFNLPYSDAPRDLPTAVAVSVLTDEGILEGNPDGTFLGGRLLNRAEFMTIVMRLLSVLPHEELPSDVNLSCFPDVPSGEWYASTVCLAKAMGIVHGNIILELPPERWRFEPERPVQYEEVMKVLVNIFKIPADLSICIQCGVQWYQPYLNAARLRGIDIAGMQPGHKLSRGEVARLVVGFLAYNDDELDLLRDAELGLADSCSPIVCNDGRVFPSCDGNQLINYEIHPCDELQLEEEREDDEGSQFNGDPVQYDPDTNTSTKANFLVLGSTSPILAAAKVFNDTEPYDVTEIKVAISGAVSSIDSFSVYDHDAEYLGKAYRDTSTEYVLPLSQGTIVIPKRENYSFYVRANMKGYKSGGVSGETVQVTSLRVEGDGVWSHRTYTKSTTETYNAFQTSRSTVSAIENGGDQNDLLVSGTDIPIGSFRFQGETGDSSADLEVTDLILTIEENDDVVVSNVTLSADGTTDAMGCSVSSTAITCSAIPAQFGDFSDTPRTLTLYGDVAVPETSQNAWLRLKLNQAGSVASAGSVTWTDGDTSFSWVPFNAPVAVSTYYSR